MDLNVLKTFVTVCEYSGFSAAGGKLGYTQSTVSSQIKQLEKELGTSLFDRIRHNVSMTSDGAIVLRYAKEILALQQKMHDELNNGENIRGKLRLAMADSVSARFFTDDYLEFHRRFPDIAISIIESGTEHMFDMLRKNEVDMVFTLDAHIYDSEFEICGEAHESTHFVASAAHPLASAGPLRLHDITSLPFILTERDMSYRKQLDMRVAEESLEIIPRLEIGNPDQICSILVNSDAISFLPDFITQRYVREGKLVFLPVEDCSISVWTQILIHRNKWHSPAIDAFIDYYRGILSEK